MSDRVTQILKGEVTMNTLVVVILWCILFLMSWPLAILAVLVWPLVWLVSLPFRILGLAFGAVFALLAGLLFLPARLLGWRSSTAQVSG